MEKRYIEDDHIVEFIPLTEDVTKIVVEYKGLKRFGLIH